MRRLAILMLCLLSGLPSYAKHDSEHPLSDKDWKEVEERVQLLDSSTFMPTLLPFIMLHRDALQLSDEQLRLLYQWRKQYYVEMVNLMNAIIEKKARFATESLTTAITDQHLLDFQAEIHALQRQLLKIRLSCRTLIVTTFTEEQWENLVFIAADNPKLAAFMPHSQTLSATHQH